MIVVLAERRVRTHDEVDMGLDGDGEVLGDAGEGVMAPWRKLGRCDLHIVAAFPIDNRHVSEGARVPVTAFLLALRREAIVRVEAHEEVAEAVVAIELGRVRLRLRLRLRVRLRVRLRGIE